MTRDAGLAGWLQLTLTPGIGPATMRALLSEYGLPEAVLSLPRSQLATHLTAETVAALDSPPVRNAVDQALEWCEHRGGLVVTLADRLYPKALLEIADPPPLLYARGRLDLLECPALAIVGSRNATAQGERNAESFARALSEAGFTIVSGLALGIDAASHRGGLSAKGSTIAVLGTGIDLVYPRRNEALAATIATQGLLVSEFPLGTPPAARNFPRRNRIISGLAQGCLVVEAALASGSLTTARAAADQGREVFAVPGSIHSPLSRGCHSLIKSGAKLVESADDIFTELGTGNRSAGYASVTSANAPSANGILGQMGHDPIDVDSLCARSGLPAEQVVSQLLQLELDGAVVSMPGGLYVRLEKGQ